MPLIKSNHSKIITTQVQDGCVTASARSLFVGLGIDFDKDVLPRLQQYQLDSKNSENNHMLGVAVVAAELNLPVLLHIKPTLKTYNLPESTPKNIKTIHAQLLHKITTLSQDKKIVLGIGFLDWKRFENEIRKELNNEHKLLVFVNWAKWGTLNRLMDVAHKKFRNTNHVVAVHDVKNNFAEIVDPSLSPYNNPVKVTLRQLYDALNSYQQFISVGNI